LSSSNFGPTDARPALKGTGIGICCIVDDRLSPQRVGSTKVLYKPDGKGARASCSDRSISLVCERLDRLGCRICVRDRCWCSSCWGETGTQWMAICAGMRCAVTKVFFDQTVVGVVASC